MLSTVVVWNHTVRVREGKQDLHMDVKTGDAAILLSQFNKLTYVLVKSVELNRFAVIL